MLLYGSSRAGGSAVSPSYHDLPLFVVILILIQHFNNFYGNIFTIVIKETITSNSAILINDIKMISNHKIISTFQENLSYIGNKKGCNMCVEKYDEISMQ